MKNKSIIFTTISLVLMVLILGFGVFSALSPTKKITSDVIFNIRDNNVNVKVEAEIGGQKYMSQTGSSGFDNDIWTIPNITFDHSENEEDTNKVVTLKLKNRNATSEVKLTVTGFAVDPEGRYETWITCQCLNSSEQPLKSQKMASSTQAFEYIIPKATERATSYGTETIATEVQLELRFTLVKFYQDIVPNEETGEHINNIAITLETPEA